MTDALFDDLIPARPKASTRLGDDGLFDDLVPRRADFSNVTDAVSRNRPSVPAKPVAAPGSDALTRALIGSGPVPSAPLSVADRNAVRADIGLGDIPEPRKGDLGEIAGRALLRFPELGGDLIDLAANLGDNIERTAGLPVGALDPLGARPVGRKAADVLRDPAREADAVGYGAQSVSGAELVEALNPNANANRRREALASDGDGEIGLGDLVTGANYTPLTMGERASRIGNFALEQSIASIPDMLATLHPATLAAYIGARTNEIAEDRAASDQRQDVNLGDLGAGAVAAPIEALLERFTTMRLLPHGTTRAAEGVLPAIGRVGRETALQGGLGGVEELAPYLASSLGTETGVSGDAALENFLGGLVAEGALGGVVQGTKEGAGALAKPVRADARPAPDLPPSTLGDAPAPAPAPAADAVPPEALGDLDALLTAHLPPEAAPIAQALAANPELAQAALGALAPDSAPAGTPPTPAPADPTAQTQFAEQVAATMRQRAQEQAAQASPTTAPAVQPSVPVAGSRRDGGDLALQPEPTPVRKEAAPDLSLDDLRAKGDARTPEETAAYARLLEADRIAAKVGGQAMPGVRNLAAYEDARASGQLQPAQAFLDLDNFKSVNDTLGHAAGDEAIRQVADVLRTELGEGSVFHRSGDEFIVQGADTPAVSAALDRARDRLSRAIVTATLPDGSVLTKTGLAFSYGAGANIEEAEHAQSDDKRARLAAGLRTDRRAEAGERGRLGESDHRAPVARGAQAGEAVGGDSAEVAELSPADLTLPERSSLQVQQEEVQAREAKRTAAAALAREQGEVDADANGLRDAVARVIGDAKNAPAVNFVRGMDALPEEVRTDLQNRNDSGRKVRTAALYDPSTGGVYLFTDVVTDPERAAWNVAHEIAGHHGLRGVLGPRLDGALDIALQNPVVSDLADAITRERKLRPAQRLLAAEEALAELAAATRTGNFDQIANRYGIEVPQAQRNTLRGAIARFMQRVRAIFGKLGATFSDADVHELVENAWRFVREGEGGETPEIGVPPATDEAGKPNGVRAPVTESVERTKSFAEQVRERLAAGDRRGAMLEMGRTPAVLRMLGFPDLPMRMPPGVLFKLATGKGGERAALTERQIARIPELLDDPVAIFDDQQGRGVLALTSIADAAGNPVLVAARPNNRDGDIEVNLVVSAFGKDGAARWVAEQVGAGRLLYRGEKENPRLDGPGLLDKQTGPVGEGSKQKVLRVDALRNYRAEQRRKMGPLESVAESETRAEQRREEAADTLPVNRGTPGWSYDENRWEGRAGQVKRLRSELQDKMLAFRDVQQQIESQLGRAIDDAQNVYRLETLMHGRVSEGIERIERAQVVPLVEAMQAAGVKPETLEEYLYARHAKERNAAIAKINPRMPDGGSGMTDAEADAILSGADKAKLEPLAKRVDAITRATRKRLLDHGLITQEAFDAMEAQYQRYVPLRGKAEARQRGEAMAGRGVDSRGQPVKQALGRGAGNRAQHILGEVIGDAQRSVILAEKARVGRAAMRLVLANPNPALWEVEPVQTERTLDAAGEVVERVVNDWSDPGVLAVRHRGQLYRVLFRQPELAKALNHVGVENIGTITRAAGAVNRYFSAILTKYNPAFVPVNATRDALFGLTGLAVEHGEAAALDAALHYLPAAHAAWRHARGVEGDSQWDRWAAEFASHGGKTGYVNMPSAEDLARKIGKGRFGGYAPEGAAKAARAVADVIGQLNDGVENALRLSAYVTLRKRGTSAEAAAEYAKNLTVNFNRKGFQGSKLNAWFLFYNASLQGAHRTSKLLRSPKTYAYLGALAGLQAVATLAALGMHDDDGEPLWNKVPDHVKRRNLVIVLPPGEGKPATVLTLAMPYGFNLFPYLSGRIVGAVADPETSRTKLADRASQITADTLTAALESFSPVPLDDGAMGLLPTVLRIPTNLQTNRNDFGRPIHRDDPYAKSDVPRASMGRPDTLEVFKLMADGLNRVGGGDEYTPPPMSAFDVAPEDIEYLVKTLTGGAGQFVVDVATLGQKATDSEFNPEVVPRDIPITKRFVTNIDEQAAQQALFYQRRDVIERALSRVRGTFETQGEDAAAALMRSLPELTGADFKRRKKSGRNGEPPGSPILVDGRPQIVAKDDDSVFGAYKAATATMSQFNEEVRDRYALTPASLLPNDKTRLRDAQLRTSERVRKADQARFTEKWTRDVVGAAE